MARRDTPQTQREGAERTQACRESHQRCRPAAVGRPRAQAIENLLTTLDDSIAQVEIARTRAAVLLEQRRAGRSWFDSVSTGRRPLVVERISPVRATVSGVGSA